MTIAERNNKLKHLITCMKCEVSGKECDNNCSTQYDAGNMGEIIENLEAISKALEQEPKKGHWIPTYGNIKCSVCGSVKDSREVGRATHYCDFCGAKMEKRLEEVEMTREETVRNLLSELTDMIDNGSQRDLDRADEISASIIKLFEQAPVTIPFIMHKEMDIPISECAKAYDVAIDYLRSHVKVKG